MAAAVDPQSNRNQLKLIWDSSKGPRKGPLGIPRVKPTNTGFPKSSTGKHKTSRNGVPSHKISVNSTNTEINIVINESRTSEGVSNPGNSVSFSGKCNIGYGEVHPNKYKNPAGNTVCEGNVPVGICGIETDFPSGRRNSSTVFANKISFFESKGDHGISVIKSKKVY